MIYLDYAADTPPCEAALAAFADALPFILRFSVAGMKAQAYTAALSRRKGCESSQFKPCAPAVPARPAQAMLDGHRRATAAVRTYSRRPAAQGKPPRFTDETRRCAQATEGHHGRMPEH